MKETQPQQSQTDLTVFSKSLFSDNPEFDLKKNSNIEKHFEPISNGFYGFSFKVTDLFSKKISEVERELNTEDIDYEDLTNQKLL